AVPGAAAGAPVAQVEHPGEAVFIRPAQPRREALGERRFAVCPGSFEAEMFAHVDRIVVAKDDVAGVEDPRGVKRRFDLEERLPDRLAVDDAAPLGAAAPVAMLAAGHAAVTHHEA